MANEYDDIINDQPANEYDSMVQESDEQDAQLVRGSMLQGFKKDPARTARVIELSNKTKLPPDLVERNFDDIAERDKIEATDYNALVKDSPGVARFLQDPNNAALAHAEVENLKRVDKATKAIRVRRKQKDGFFSQMGRAFQTGMNQLNAGSNHLGVAFGKANVDEAAIRIADANKRAAALRDKQPDYAKEFNRVMEKEGADINKGFGKFLGSFDTYRKGKTLEALKEFVAGDIETTFELIDMIGAGIARPKAVAYSTVESLAHSLPALVTGAAGGLAGGKAAAIAGQLGPQIATPEEFVTVPLAATVGFMGGTFAGSAYSEVGSWIDQAMTKRGYDTTDPESIKLAYSNPEVISLVRNEALRKGLTTAAVDAAFSMFAGSLVAKNAAKPLLTRTAARAADIGIQSVGEATSEAAGQVAAEKGDLSKLDLGGAVLEGIVSLGHSTAEVSVGAGLKPAAKKIRNQFSANPLDAAQEVAVKTNKSLEAIENAGILGELAASMTDSELTKIPGKIKELMEFTSEADPEAVFFQADDWDNYWNKKGESPGEKAAEMSPEVAKRYLEAQQNGTDIEVPLGDFLESVAGSEHLEGLIPIAKTEPDGMNFEQAQQHLKDLPGLVDSVAQEAIESDSDVTVDGEKKTTVKTQVRDQLKDAGYSHADASVQAEIYQARMDKRAALRGTTAEALFASDGGVEIKMFDSLAELSETQAPGQVFDQSGTRKIDTPAFKEFFGESKVVDDAGAPLVIHHGGLGAASIEEFSRDFASQTTGNNEIGVFHFVDNTDVSEDYGRQSFIRRYQDNPESLVEDGVIEGLPEFDSIDDQYAFVEELAESNIETQSVYASIQNPIIIDNEGERVDVQFIENITKFAVTGVDETGEFFDQYFDQMFEGYDESDIQAYSEEIAERARENEGLDDNEAISKEQFDSAAHEIMQENGIDPERKNIDGIIIKNMVDDISPKSNIIADQYIVFNPEQIKSVNNKGTFDPTSPNIFFQGNALTPAQAAGLQPNELGYYSKLKNVIENLDFKASNAKEIANRLGSWNILSKDEVTDEKTGKVTTGRKLKSFQFLQGEDAEKFAAANNGSVVWDSPLGIKAEEIEWTGLEHFFHMKAFAGEKISKGEMLEYLEKNGVQIKQVVFGSEGGDGGGGVAGEIDWSEEDLGSDEIDPDGSIRTDNAHERVNEITLDPTDIHEGMDTNSLDYVDREYATQMLAELESDMPSEVDIVSRARENNDTESDEDPSQSELDEARDELMDEIDFSENDRIVRDRLHDEYYESETEYMDSGDSSWSMQRITAEVETEETTYEIEIQGSDDQGHWRLEIDGNHIDDFSNGEEAKIQAMVWLSDEGVTFGAAAPLREDEISWTPSRASFNNPSAAEITAHYLANKERFDAENDSLIDQEIDPQLELGVDNDEVLAERKRKIEAKFKDFGETDAETELTKAITDPNNRTTVFSSAVETPKLNAILKGSVESGFFLSLPDADGIQDDIIINADNMEAAKAKAMEAFRENNIFEEPPAVAELPGMTDLNRPRGSGKFGSYMLDGGENYREVLLELDSLQDYSKINQWAIFSEAGVQLGKATFETEEAAIASMETGKDWTGFSAKQIKDSTRVEHTAGHWSGQATNVTAHIRLKDRRTLDGKKIMSIGEFQSDWHKQGRDNGYDTPAQRLESERLSTELADLRLKEDTARGEKQDIHNEKVTKLARMTPDEKAEWLGLDVEMEFDLPSLDFKTKEEGTIEIRGRGRFQGLTIRVESDGEIDLRQRFRTLETLEINMAGDTSFSDIKESFDAELVPLLINYLIAQSTVDKLTIFDQAEQDRYNELTAELDQLETDTKEIQDLYNLKSNPATQGPYKGNAWIVLAVKRALSMAIQEGHDSIIIDPGEAQIPRYGVSKQIDGLYHSKVDSDSYKVTVFKNNRPLTLKQEIYSSQQLGDLLGKGLAKKIINNEGTVLEDIEDNQEFSTDTRAIEGIDLDVGGRGHIKLYNEIIPNIVKGMLKKLDKTAKLGVVKATDLFGHELEEKGHSYNDFWHIPITQKMRDDIAKGQALFQGGQQDPKGQIKFNEPGGVQISLFKNADPSTFLHETGHLWLDEVRRDFAFIRNQGVPNAEQAQFLEDYKTIIEHLGVDSLEGIGTEQHELFARSVETYFMEGKAPNEKLRRAFARFRVWLTSVYRQLRNLNAPLTREVREVFNRMLAAADEVAQAESEMKISPLFTNSKKAGMSEKSARAYTRAVLDAHLASEEFLSAKLLADWARAESVEYKKARKSEEEAVTIEADGMRVYQTLAQLRGGKMPDGTPMKISRESLVSEFDAELVKSLPKPFIYSREGGIQVDVAASMLGYETASEMIQEIAASVPKKQFIKTETDRRMDQLFPNMQDDNAVLEAAALEAVHNDKQAQVKRMELEHLAANNMAQMKEGIRKIARRVPSNRAVKAQAQRTIEAMPAGQIKPGVFSRAERNASKMAGESFAKGDFEAAFDWKQKELLSFHLFKEAVAAKEKVKKTLKDFRKISKADEKIAKTRDTNIVLAARALLAKHGIGKKTDQDPEKILEPIKLYEPEAYETIQPLVEASSVVAGPYEEMPFGQFIDLKNTVDALWDLSKLSKQVEVDGQRVEVDAVGELIQGGIDQHKQKKHDGAYNRKKTAWENTKIKLMSWRSALTRVETWVDVMDLGDFSGIFRKALFEPISDASAQYRLDIVKRNEQFIEIIRPIENQLNRGKIVAPELINEVNGKGYEFESLGQVLGVLLHIGNPSNKSKLVRGYKWGDLDETGALDTSKLDAFVARLIDEGTLTKEHFDVIQQLWDLMEELKPGAQKAHKRMFGFFFQEVQAEEVITPFGNYRGGYAPAVVDSREVVGHAIKEEKSMIESFNPAFAFPVKTSGFTKTRVEQFAAPLQIDLSLVPSHISAVLKQTHIKPRAMEVARILLDPKIANQINAFDQTVIKDMLRPWLVRSAEQTVEQPAEPGNIMLNDIMRGLRKRTGMSIMFGNVVNTIQQFTGLSLTALKVKPKYIKRAFVSYLKRPKGLAQDVSDKSDFMRTRTDIQMFEVTKTANKLLVDPTLYEKAADFAERHAYILQQMTQNIVDTTSWGAAYDQAIGEGMTEKQAVKSADSVVRQTQGSFSAEDISAFESGTAFARAFKMFYSYFNMLANLNAAEMTKIVKDLGIKKGAGRLTYVYLMGILAPALAAELMVAASRGKFDEDEDGEYLDDFINMFFGSQRRTLTAFIPFIGQAVNLGFDVTNDKWFDDRMSLSPGLSVAESAIKGNTQNISRLLEGKDVKGKKIIRDSLTALSLISGFPVAPLAKPLGYLSEVAEGNTKPTGPIDFTRGVITGKSSD